LTKEICGGARRNSEAGKAASRAERASNVPRNEKDHAFSLIVTMKKGIAY
jgi:hypothetical protein